LLELFDPSVCVLDALLSLISYHIDLIVRNSTAAAATAAVTDTSTVTTATTLLQA
jgi:hypothetical protein